VRKNLAMIVWVLFFFLSANTASADFSGPVVSVLDGDTIEVLHNQQPERIRLNGIDARRNANPGDFMWWKTSS
jgi:endonuclease YncB( thermonuclease family)